MSNIRSANISLSCNTADHPASSIIPRFLFGKLGAIIFAFFAIAVLAQSGHATLFSPFTFETVEVAAPFDQQTVPSTFTVPITTGDITAAGIDAFQFNLVYDPSVINTSGPNFGCTTVGTLAGNAGLNVICNVTPDGRLRVAVYGNYPMTGSGTILNLTFATNSGAIAGNVSPLVFENVHFFNQLGEVSTTARDGQISLVTFSPTPTPVPVVVAVSAPIADQNVPSTFTVPITAQNLSGAGIVAFQFDLAYDPQVIDPSGPNFGCSTEGTLAGAVGMFVNCNVTTEGTLRLSVYGVDPMTGSGTIMNLTFSTDPTATVGTMSELRFENVLFFDQWGPVTSGLSDGLITLIAPVPTPTPTATPTSTPTPTATPTSTPTSTPTATPTFTPTPTATPTVLPTPHGNGKGRKPRLAI